MSSFPQRLLRSAIASSSRSARKRTTGCGGFRRYSVARSRTAIRPPSSIARSRCSSRRSSGRRPARRPGRGLSVPGRIRTDRGTPRTSPGEWPGGGTMGSAGSWLRTDSAAASALSSNTTTSTPTRSGARRRRRTSRSGAAVTTNTRRNGSSGLATPLTRSWYRVIRRMGRRRTTPSCDAPRTTGSLCSGTAGSTRGRARGDGAGEGEANDRAQDG